MRIDAARERADASPIVLLHEGLGSVAMWKSFPALLAERTGRAVIAYSRAGYGRSSSRTQAYDVDYLHREATRVLPMLLTHLGVGAPLLYGHSDGASIALIFAMCHRAVPVALILEAPHAFVEPCTLERIAAVRPEFSATTLRERLARYHDDVDGAFYGWYDIWLDPRFAQFDIRPNLSRVDIPVLLMQGLDDPYGTIAQIDAIRAGVRGSVETVLFPNTAHSPHREAQASVLDAVAAFSDRLS